MRCWPAGASIWLGVSQLAVRDGRVAACCSMYQEAAGSWLTAVVLVVHSVMASLLEKKLSTASSLTGGRELRKGTGT
jgi:hypothetical protein